MPKAFVSWSGGKDCCQAAYRAQLQGYQISYLLNMVHQDNERSCSHGLATRWIQVQSKAMGIPLIQPVTKGDDYEAVFINTLRKLSKEDIHTGIFGDIDFEPHREWNNRVCGEAGIAPVLPLWQIDQNLIADNFIKSGFQSVVVATQADLLGREWLGRQFDTEFLKDLAAFNKSISPCGEAGEFHTLVVNGPLFKKRLEIKAAEKVQRQNHWFLDIRDIELVEN